MPADTTIREGYFDVHHDGDEWTAQRSQAWETDVPCVVVTGRTAQDVTRLLREPTDEDIERAAIALYVFDFDSWELESDGMRDHYRWWARKAIAAYRSPEEADRA